MTELSRSVILAGPGLGAIGTSCDEPPRRPPEVREQAGHGRRVLEVASTTVTCEPRDVAPSGPPR
jgi:hypothetical protein